MKVGTLSILPLLSEMSAKEVECAHTFWDTRPVLYNLKRSLLLTVLGHSENFSTLLVKGVCMCRGTGGWFVCV